MGATDALGDATGAKPGSRALLVASTMLATLLFTIDTTVANIALPHMLGSLQATQEQGAWVLTAYIVASAVMTPLAGFLATRYGVRNIILGCIAGFIFFSCLCGAAQSLTQIVAFRALQGVFGAGLVPLSQVALLSVFPKKDHGRATALWGIGVMLGPVLGPPLGGYITEMYGWRWVFYVNVPVGALALFGTSLGAADAGRDPARRFDALGFALLALTLGLAQMFLDRGNDLRWFESAQSTATALAAAICAYMFIVHSMTRADPFLHLSLFRDRNFVLCTSLMTAVGVVMYASIALQIPFTQNLQGYSVIDGGLLGAPRGIGMMLGMMLASPLLGRIDPRYLLATGAFALGITLLELRGFTLDVSAARVAGVTLLQGFGIGLMFVPMGTLAFATLPDERRAEAGAFFSVTRNLGGSIGIASSFGLLSWSTDTQHARLVENLDSFEAARWSELARTALGDSPALLDMELTRQAAVIGYGNVYTAVFVVLLLTVPLLMLIRLPTRQSVDPLATSIGRDGEA